jgi:hypothetical protein
MMHLIKDLASPHATVVACLAFIFLFCSQDLVRPLAQAISHILHHPRPQQAGKQHTSTERKAILAFGERAGTSSPHFVSLDEVCSALTCAELSMRAIVHARHRVERAPGEHMSIVVLCVEPL